ncbi:hypothetical protein FRC05_010927 [Tulasnella sp. 425]|nr:hypothetical protein FRC05_010927 [Tulasnella sp. 425]
MVIPLSFDAPGTTNGYVIPAQWQSTLSNGSSAGGIIDLLFNGYAADRWGPKIVMMTSIIALTGFIFIVVFANSLTMLVIGEWIWFCPLFLIAWFRPPSPWWLVRKGRLEEAEAAIRRLTNQEKVSADDAKATVAMMVHTNELEKEAPAGITYLDCFRNTDRRRTGIVMMVFAMQLLSGENLIGQGVQFLQTAGISTNTAFSLSMVLNSMFIIVLTIFGRRTLYTAGMASMSVVLFIIGGLAWIGTKSSIFAIGSLLIVLNFAYNATLGPICYTLIGEISSTRLRQKSIVLSSIAYQIMNLICGIIVPRMLSPTAWNWGPKYGISWGVSAGLSTLYRYLRLPETKNRSCGELGLLFDHKVPAWRFKSTKVDQFAAHGVVGNDVEYPDSKEEIKHLD